MRSVLKHFRNDPLPGLAGATAAAGMVSIGACHTLLGLSLGALLIRRKQFRMTPYWPAIAVFMAATVASALVNGHFREGWPQIRKFYVWAMLPVVYSGLRTAWQARQTLIAMAVGGTASAAWGMVQFYRKYEQAVASGVPFYQSYVGSRITGFTSHWQTFAGDMMLAFLIVTALLLALNPLLLALNPKWRWAAVGSLVLLGLALLLGFTRSIWPATAAGLIVLLWHWRPIAVLSLPVLAGVTIVAAPEPLHSRIVSLWKPNAALDSNEHRAVLRRTGIAMAGDHPLFGVGPEEVQRHFEEYYPADAPHPVPTEWYTKHLHNTYIHYAAERGIVAMLGLVSFVLLAWWRMLSALRGQAMNPDRRFVLLVAAAAVPGILVGGWWEVNLGDRVIVGRPPIR